MTRSTTRALLGYLLVASACGGGDKGGSGGVTPPPGPTVVRGVLLAELTTPNADDGAVILTVSGPAIDSVSVTPYAGAVSSGAGERRVLVYGNLRAGTVARVHIRDVSQASAYSIRLEEAASRVTFQQRPLTGYSVQLRTQ